ncbi:MAG: response regulator [Hyphomicrobiales bacterium]
MEENATVRCVRSAPGEATGRLVLVVDDEESIRCVAWEILRYLGYGVETVATGEAALEKLERGMRPDVILLDVVMPGIGGAETYSRIRAKHPTLPVVIVSGFTDRASAAALAREGVNAVLGKPFDIETLRRKLKEILG